MHASHMSGHKAGFLANKHKQPIFPKTHAEMQRLTGITFDWMSTCQETASPLVDLSANAYTAPAAGNTRYKRPVKGVMEYGIENGPPAVGGWQGDNQPNVFPGATSCLMLIYMESGPVDFSGNNSFGIYSDSDGAGANLQYFRYLEDGGGFARFLALDASGNLKEIPLAGLEDYKSGDRNARGVALGIDVSSALLRMKFGAKAIQGGALGSWSGINSQAGINGVFVGEGPLAFTSQWPQRFRFGAIAKGTQLNGMLANGENCTMNAIMRKLGWI